MISIVDYESAQKWLDEAIKDCEDMDERNQFITLQEVLDDEHEQAEQREALSDVIEEIEQVIRDAR